MPGLLSSLRAAGIDGTAGVVGIRRGLRPVTGFGDVEVSDSDGGLNVGRNPGIGPVVAMGPAKIVTTGPDDEDDYTDCRYWLSWLRAKQVNGDKVELTESGTHSDVQIFTATSLADEADDTHALQAGARVFVFAQEDENGADRLVFLPAAAGDVIVRVVDATGTGNGIYNAKIRIPASAPLDPTVNLSAGALGSDGADCVVVNMQEVNGSGHWLTAPGNTNQRYFLGRVIGTSTTGKPVVAINGLWAKACA